MGNTTEKQIRNLEHPAGKIDMVLDTDAYNEIDDQFAIAYMLRNSDKLNVKAIYAAPFLNEKSTSPKDGMEKSYEEIKKIISLAHCSDIGIGVYKGSENFLHDEQTPVKSPAAEHLVGLASSYTPDNPLYVAAIGAITNVASAILMKPEIADNIVVIWLGGNAHHWHDTKEFNLYQDVAAARIIFGCGVPLVQLPCAGVVSAFTISEAELEKWLLGYDDLCDYLACNTIKEASQNAAGKPWTRVIWDVTAVAWLVSSRFFIEQLEKSPIPEYDGHYAFSTSRHFIKYVSGIDRDALVDDLFKKLRAEQTITMEKPKMTNQVHTTEVSHAGANHHWSMDAIVYHIYSLSLVNAPHDNDYTTQSHKLNEIGKWVEHIKELGCNAVLFSPIMKAGSHGYDVTDYYVIDNRIGTNDEFAALTRLFHDNGVRVLLDCVFNHSGRDFFAFKELQSGNRDYAGWYSGVDFSRQSPLGDSFTYDTWSGHFKLPKFNLKDERMCDYLLDAARYWIKAFDIDGMRLDAADVLDMNFMCKLRRITEEMKPGFWLMGEVVHGDYTRWINPDTLHSVTNYTVYKSLFSSHNDGNLFELAHSLQQSRPDNGLPLFNFLDNHDQPRITSIINNPSHLKTLYALLYTIPGIPSIYYGSEWGIQGNKDSYSDWPLRPYIDISKPPASIPWLECYIRKLADIRHSQEALRYGRYCQVYLEYNKPFVFERNHGSNRVFTAVNIGSNDETVSLEQHCSGSLIDLLSGRRMDASHVTVPAHDALILKP